LRKAGQGQRFVGVDELWLTCRRTTERSIDFQRDPKREAQGKPRATLEGDLRLVLLTLAIDQALGPGAVLAP
jgi:hypothetical protein